MSARRATPEARCVWITEEQRTALERYFVGAVISDIIDQFDHAPANPVEATFSVLRTGLDPAAWYVQTLTNAVLVALGYPDGSPRQETPT